MKNTQELLELLESSDNLKTYLDAASDSMTIIPLHELLESFRKKKQMKKSHCIAAASLHREYGYQIFSGTKMPSRDKILSLCLAMHLTREESNILLRAGGYNDLYSKNRRDSILIFALSKNLSVIETNLLLDEIQEQPL